MNSDVVEVEVKGTLPTSGGCAVFLGNEEKVFVIYIDQMVGNAIMMLMKDMATERPQTHDLFSDVLKALGANVQRVVINDYIDEVFYGRLILTVENEIEDREGRPELWRTRERQTGREAQWEEGQVQQATAFAKKVFQRKPYL